VLITCFVIYVAAVPLVMLGYGLAAFEMDARGVACPPM